jgi:hypothetical protein
VLRRRIGYLLVVVAVTAAVTNHAGASSGRVYLNVQGYGAKPVVKYRPRQLNRITGDGTAYVDRIRWRRWNESQAYATGYAHVDDCVPDCADGTFSVRPTHLHAYRVRFCHAANRNVYTRLSIRGIHVGGRPVIAMSHDCND